MVKVTPEGRTQIMDWVNDPDQSLIQNLVGHLVGDILEVERERDRLKEMLIEERALFSDGETDDHRGRTKDQIRADIEKELKEKGESPDHPVKKERKS